MILSVSPLPLNPQYHHNPSVARSTVSSVVLDYTIALTGDRGGPNFITQAFVPSCAADTNDGKMNWDLL